MKSDDNGINLVTYVGKGINWDPEQGNPFDFANSEVKEKCEMPHITMMTDWDKDADLDALLPETITTVKFNLHLKRIFETIKTPNQSQILQPNEDKAYEKEKYVDGIQMIQEGDTIHKKEGEVHPVTVYLDYPLGKIAQVKIYPYIRTHLWKDGEITETKCMNFGYIVWQISRAYAEIYKNEWKEYGVWAHAYEDLWLETMTIKKNNIITLFVGS